MTHLLQDAQRQPVDVPLHELVVLIGNSLNEKKARITKDSTGEYKCAIGCFEIDCFRATWTIDKPGPYPVDVRYHGNSILVPVPIVQFFG